MSYEILVNLVDDEEPNFTNGHKFGTRLQKTINDFISLGEIECKLGIQKMPEGYALMRNPDGYYYWLQRNERQSQIHWNKWSVYYWAKIDQTRKGEGQ